MSTIAFIGNVNLGGAAGEQLDRVGPEGVWGTALPVLRSANAVIASLECAFTRCQQPSTLVAKSSYMRADPAAVEVLQAANVRCVSLASEHILDYGEEGLLDTLEALDAAGIGHAGAGRSLAQAAAPAIIRLPDLVAGMVTLTDTQPAFAAARRAPGTHYVDIELAPPPEIGLAQLASVCRERGADVSILSLHWGPKMVSAPSYRFREFASTAIEAGFDLLHGHASRIFHGVGMYRGRPIFYDTGDTVTEPQAFGDLRNDSSFIFLVDLTKTHVERIRLVPLVVGLARVDVATGAAADTICHRMARQCTAMGTDVKVLNGEIEVSLDVPVAV